MPDNDLPFRSNGGQVDFPIPFDEFAEIDFKGLDRFPAEVDSEGSSPCDEKSPVFLLHHPIS